MQQEGRKSCGSVPTHHGGEPGTLTERGPESPGACGIEQHASKEHTGQRENCKSNLKTIFHQMKTHLSKFEVQHMQLLEEKL